MVIFQPILKTLELNKFQKKSKNSYETKISQQIFIECKHTIDFMLKGESLLGYTNPFFPKEYEKNDKVILKRF